MDERHPHRKALTEADADRVADVFTEHRAFIENVARRHAVADDAVQDIVQAVGLNVCKTLRSFRGDSSIRTWLFRVTVNAARDHYGDHRRMERARQALTERPGPDSIEDPEQQVILGQRVERLRQAVHGLRPIYRDTLLADLRNDTAGETVQSDQKQESHRTRRWRARQQLRQALSDDGPN